jgi:hypothetical protein
VAYVGNALGDSQQTAIMEADLLRDAGFVPPWYPSTLNPKP